MEASLLWLGALLTIFIRWTVSLFPYSGQRMPPMYGDLEGFRHWMEISNNLNVSEWYVNSSRNDLQYWGFDYPPLTAYHSYLCGFVAKWINPAWIELNKSRGLEGYYLKLFMRYSVLVTDLIILYPAVILYFYKSNCQEKLKACAAVSTFLYPGLILIDHGHFQFNCVSLGFLVWALTAFNIQYDLLGCVAFCLALNYKQMELYHSLPIFCYLLGSSLQSKSFLKGLQKVSLCGIVVLATFAVCWYPFLFDQEVTWQVLRRLFPFDRGLYEDKVANVWCSLEVLVKFKKIFSVPTLIRISFATTLICLLPSCFNLLKQPSFQRLKLALVNSSLIFFLVSFHVHEKSILLAAIIVCLILPEFPLASVWFLVISVFSMYPLIFKDGLIIPLYATLTIYLLIVSRAFLKKDLERMEGKFKLPVIITMLTSIIGGALLSLAALLIFPPKRYPDLHSLLCAVYSCGHFILFTGYFHWQQFKVTDFPQTKIHTIHKSSFNYTKLKNE